MSSNEMKNEMKKGIYDFIASHYWELTTEEMKTISLEMFWQLEQAKGDVNVATLETIKALEEDGFFEN